MDVGQVIAGRYELEELVGTGGTANVYRASDRLLERRIAVRVLHDRFARDTEYVERFRREARAVARLSHPNIVTVINLGEAEGRPFIVLEYVGGETLEDLLRREGRLSVRSALTIVRGVACGIAFAHEHGVVHRGVKPQNVIIDSEGTPKVTDFGIVGPLNGQERRPTSGSLVGTTDNVAPEQAAGGSVSERSDQYSLGVLLYQLLTGELPYPAEVETRHLNEPVPSVRDARPDVPPAVDELVRRAMQKDPEDRFPSTGAFLAGLDACLASYEEDTLSDLRGADPATQVAAPSGRDEREPARRIRPARRRGRILLLVAALLAAAALATLTVLLFRDRGSLSLGGDSGGAGGAASIRVAAVADHDPAGDDTEHPEAIAAATDGNPATFWTTETYFSGFSKPGVGVVLRASDPVGGGTLVVRSDEGGYTAEIRASNNRGSGFETISEAQTVGRRTAFELDTGGEEYRFLLVWITDLGEGNRAHINEVALRPPEAA